MMSSSQHETQVNQDMKKRTILIALDYSKHSQHAYEWAKGNLLNTATDHVVLVNVRQINMGYAGSFYPDVGQLVRDYEERDRESSHKLLQHYGYDLKRLGYDVRAISILGDSRADLIRKAEELSASILVCGSRGLGTLKRTFLGSVSNYIVNHCTCPVLVIRPHKDSDLDVHGSKLAVVHASKETAKVSVDQETSHAGVDAVVNDPADVIKSSPPSIPVGEGIQHAMSA